MKNSITYILIFTLLFSFLTPKYINAQKINNSESKVSIGSGVLEGYTFTTTMNDSKRSVLADNGVEKYEATYDLETGDLYLDGQLVPSELRSLVDEIGNSMVSESEGNINSFTIRPFSVDQGAGFGGSQWKYEWTDNGSFSYTSLAVGALAGLVASIFTGGIVVPAIAGVVSAFVSALSSERGRIYYTWKRYTKPHWRWPVLYKEYKDEVWFYKDSNRYQLITSATFYR
ncbi:hypothetical protein ACIQXI_16545 [Lysinibacillus sp. NPDC097195]|uniref:hypothetical protein n=1 Tax=Lysinibacillus sp. NPDC097195 TaxID=3364141 RepID=UPI00382BF228